MTKEIEEIRKVIASELGISAPEISNSIIYKIHNDELYLHHLSVCKDDKDLLKILLNEPEKKSDDIILPSNSELFLNLSKSLTKWIGSGLKKTSKLEYERRISVCNKCPNKVKSDSRFIYQIVNPDFICKICGCDLNKKAMFQSETCPDIKFSTNGRW
jgi:hypothetical protein